MFGFESLTLRATSLCTTQEFLLPGMDHTGQVQTWIYGSAIQGLPQLFRQGDRARESGQLCSHQGYSGCQDRVTHRSVGRAAQWGRQKNEGIRKGLWLVKSFFFFNAFPAFPACCVFKKLQFPSPPALLHKPGNADCRREQAPLHYTAEIKPRNFCSAAQSYLISPNFDAAQGNTVIY